MGHVSVTRSLIVAFYLIAVTGSALLPNSVSGQLIGNVDVNSAGIRLSTTNNPSESDADHSMINTEPSNSTGAVQVEPTSIGTNTTTVKDVISSIDITTPETNDDIKKVTTTSSVTENEEEEEKDENDSNKSEDVTNASEEEADEGGSSDSDNGDDPWAEVDEENTANANIVDQMREIRDKEVFGPIIRNTSNLNETFARVQHAWEILDQYYLPQKATWEKLLGLVTGLNVDVSPECFASYFSGVSGFRGYNAWAYRYLDVRGRFPESGSMSGRLGSFGEWDECLELDSPQSSSTGLIVKGQYCILEVKIPYPNNTNGVDITKLGDENHPAYKFLRKYLRTFRLHRVVTPAKVLETLALLNGTIFRAGLCIPELCKSHEIEAVISNLTYPIFKMPIQLGPKCFKKDTRVTFQAHQVIAMSVLTALTTFVIFCTVVEWYNNSFDKRTAKDNSKLGSLMFQRDVASKPNPFLYSFSGVTNTRALFRKNTSFAALDTIKFLMVLYIHLYHYYNYLSTVGLVTLKRIFTTYPIMGMREDRYAWFRITLPFDAIFVISGMVIAFSMQRKLSLRTSNFNYFSYAAKLWCKFAVTYAGSILFLFVLPAISTGPVWEHGMNWLNGCLDWRATLFGFLFISNYNAQIIGDSGQTSVLPYCNPPTWLMSTLLQLLLLAPLLVYIAYKLSKRAKIAYFTILVIFSAILTITPYLLLGVKPEVHFLEFETLRDTFAGYVWYRLGTNTYLLSFVLGIIGGYMLADFKVLLRQELENVMVIVSIVLVQMAIALNNAFWRLDKPPALFSSLMWYSCIRLLQSLGLTYIFYTLASNRAAMIQRFLEWQPFQVVSRLAYSYFMVHILVIFYRIFSVKEVYAMENSLMLQNFFIDFFFTMILAYLFYCLIECPVANLLNLAHGKIFYDVKQCKPRSNSAHMADMNGNSGNNNNTETKEECAARIRNNEMFAYPPNIVIQEFCSISSHEDDHSSVAVPSNEFEMNTRNLPHIETNNNNNNENRDVKNGEPVVAVAAETATDTETVEIDSSDL